jgi:hypothetical protein
VFTFRQHCLHALARQADILHKIDKIFDLMNQQSSDWRGNFATLLDAAPDVPVLPAAAAPVVVEVVVPEPVLPVLVTDTIL